MVEVVAALVHDTENPRRFLICQRPAHKARGLLWEFVGGKVESGETKREALARECREELGVAVSVGDVYMELTHVYPDLTIHLTLFHAEITDGVPQLLEHCAMDWITPEWNKAHAFFSTCMGRPLLSIEIKDGETGKTVSRTTHALDLQDLRERGMVEEFTTAAERRRVERRADNGGLSPAT